MLFKSPAARYVAHILIVGATAFFVSWSAAGTSLEKSVLLTALSAGAMAMLGALTSTHPEIGKNLL